MHETSLFLIFVRRLNQLGVPYVVTGSVASMLYGEPRLTHDIDLVIELPRDRIEPLIAAFPADTFYCPPLDVIAVEAARASRGHLQEEWQKARSMPG